MKRTFYPILISIAGLLLASYSFSGQAQIGSPILPDGVPMPEALAGFPGATAEWWAAAQAELHQELGQELDLNASPDWSAVGQAQGDRFGIRVASAGDVNGDGYADLAIGADNYNSVGKAYVYHGSAGLLNVYLPVIRKAN